MNKKGFTFIEIMTAIAIVGVLSSIIMMSALSAKAKARDAVRRSDLTQMATALGLYYDTFKSYPDTSGVGWQGVGNCSGAGINFGLTGSGGYIPNLAPTYISVLPTDPTPKSGYCYLYKSNGVDYKLLAYGTVESSCPVRTSDSMYDPIRSPAAGLSAPITCTYQISTVGGASW